MTLVVSRTHRWQRSLARLVVVCLAADAGAVLATALLAGGLAAVRLPHAHPGRSTREYAWAMAASLVLAAASVVVHAVAHARTAQQSGVDGGRLVLRLHRGEPTDPEVAYAGPLASFIAGGVFGCAAALTFIGGVDGLAVTVLAHAGVVNLFLAGVTVVTDGRRAKEQSRGQSSQAVGNATSKISSEGDADGKSVQ
jgi:hypothetical protein